MALDEQERTVLFEMKAQVAVLVDRSQRHEEKLQCIEKKMDIHKDHHTRIEKSLTRIKTIIGLVGTFLTLSWAGLLAWFKSWK